MTTAPAMPTRAPTRAASRDEGCAGGNGDLLVCQFTACEGAGGDGAGGRRAIGVVEALGADCGRCAMEVTRLKQGFQRSTDGGGSGDGEVAWAVGDGCLCPSAIWHSRVRDVLAWTYRCSRHALRALGAGQRDHRRVVADRDNGALPGHILADFGAEEELDLRRGRSACSSAAAGCRLRGERSHSEGGGENDLGQHGALQLFR